MPEVETAAGLVPESDVVGEVGEGGDEVLVGLALFEEVDGESSGVLVRVVCSVGWDVVGFGVVGPGCCVVL